MIVVRFVGDVNKFVECTLGVKYRKIDSDGEVSGGPMYYLRDGLSKYGMSRLGKGLAVLLRYCVLEVLWVGVICFKPNQVYAQLSGQFPLLSGNGPILKPF